MFNLNQLFIDPAKLIPLQRFTAPQGRGGGVGKRGGKLIDYYFLVL
jgi:hypothetical protein